MNYGIIAASYETEMALPSGYVKGAVSFAPGTTHSGFPDGTLLTLASLACTDNQYWGFAGWFKTDWTSGFPVAFISDPNNNYCNTLAGGQFVANDGSHNLSRDFTASGSTTWHHIIGAADTNHAAGSKVIAVYVDDTLSTGTKTDAATAFMNTTNGLEFYIGTDTYNTPYVISDVYLGSMSDLSIWPGIDLMQGGNSISEGIRRLFIDVSGNSVDPTVPGGLIDTLGHPPIFLTGNAASFPSNTLGTAGAFTVMAGSLTDDPDLPP